MASRQPGGVQFTFGGDHRVADRGTAIGAQAGQDHVRPRPVRRAHRNDRTHVFFAGPLAELVDAEQDRLVLVLVRVPRELLDQVSRRAAGDLDLALVLARSSPRTLSFMLPETSMTIAAARPSRCGAGAKGRARHRSAGPPGSSRAARASGRDRACRRADGKTRGQRHERRGRLQPACQRSARLQPAEAGLYRCKPASPLTTPSFAAIRFATAAPEFNAPSMNPMNA